jgi:hypothetical protein
MTVDREGRDRLAECIRHLAAGVMTNREFESKGDFDSPDPAIQAVFWGGPWLLYDDFRNYRLRGAYRIDPAVRREAARWILFLKTDLPYEWPVIRRHFMGNVARLLTNLVTLGHVARRTQRRFEQKGDVRIWPFIRRADYEAAVADPTYLRGRSSS